MKKIFFLLTFCLSFALSFQAIGQYDGYLNDTLSTSSSIDTVILYPGGSTEAGASTAALAKTFSIEGSLNVIVATDSLSGSTNATLYVQYANRDDPNVWYNASTTTLNGPTQQVINIDDPVFTARKWRIWAVTASGTQATRIRCEWTFKRAR